MKQVIYCLFVLLFARCSIINNNVFIKRKYTKGYFFQTKHNKNSTAINNDYKSNQQVELRKIENNSVSNKSVSSNLVVLQSSLGNTITLKKSSVKNSPISYKIKSKTPVDAEDMFLESSKNFIDKNVFGKFQYASAEKKEGGNLEETLKLSLYTLLFIFLTVVYTISIIFKAPGFPIFLALPIAMILALLTLLTGIYFF